MEDYSLTMNFIIDRHCIVYFKCVLEAYDNIVILTTKNSTKGLISLSIAPDCKILVMEIIADLVKNGSIKIATDPK